jgi:tRNA(His) guanylyltransferase
MTDTSALGDRMKLYEAATRAVLPRRTYTVIRVDGRAFHAYLRKAERPFDAGFSEAMDSVARALCAEISGSVLAFAESDEVSVLAADFGSVHTEPWFGGVVQKMASVAASTATAALAHATRRTEPHPYRSCGLPQFDGRVFTIPGSVEVANYFLWRQRDAVRNSVSMAAQAHFSHTSLHGLNGSQMQERLFAEKGVNWNDYPDGFKRGRVCVREAGEEEISYVHKRSGEQVTTTAVRSRWVTRPAPRFTATPGSFLAAIIPPLPSLEAAIQGETTGTP